MPTQQQQDELEVQKLLYQHSPSFLDKALGGYENWQQEHPYLNMGAEALAAGSIPLQIAKRAPEAVRGAKNIYEAYQSGEMGKWRERAAANREEFVYPHDAGVALTEGRRPTDEELQQSINTSLAFGIHNPKLKWGEVEQVLEPDPKQGYDGQYRIAIHDRKTGQQYGHLELLTDPEERHGSIGWLEAKLPKDIGPGHLLHIKDELAEQFPDMEDVQFFRTSGAKKKQGLQQTVTMPIRRKGVEADPAMLSKATERQSRVVRDTFPREPPEESSVFVPGMPNEHGYFDISVISGDQEPHNLVGYHDPESNFLEIDATNRLLGMHESHVANGLREMADEHFPGARIRLRDPHVDTSLPYTDAEHAAAFPEPTDRYLERDWRRGVSQDPIKREMMDELRDVPKEYLPSQHDKHPLIDWRNNSPLVQRTKDAWSQVIKDDGQNGPYELPAFRGGERTPIPGRGPFYSPDPLHAAAYETAGYEGGQEPRQMSWRESVENVRASTVRTKRPLVLSWEDAAHTDPGLIKDQVIDKLDLDADARRKFSSVIRENNMPRVEKFIAREAKKQGYDTVLRYSPTEDYMELMDPRL